MAVDTNITAQTGSAGIPAKVVMYQRLIDFSVNNLAVGAWFQLFSLPVNSIVMSGQADLVLTGTATSTFDVGIEDGAELLSATSLDGTTGTATAFTATAMGVSFDSDTVDISINTAQAVLGKVRVTAVVALCDVL